MENLPQNRWPATRVNVDRMEPRALRQQAVAAAAAAAPRIFYPPEQELRKLMKELNTEAKGPSCMPFLDALTFANPTGNVAVVDGVAIVADNFKIVDGKVQIMRNGTAPVERQIRSSIVFKSQLRPGEPIKACYVDIVCPSVRRRVLLQSLSETAHR
jgi:hypothetical protein